MSSSLRHSRQVHSRSQVSSLRSLVLALALLGCALPARSQVLFDANAGDTHELTQPPAPPPAKPEHTGFKALVFETASDFNAFPRRKSTWVLLGYRRRRRGTGSSGRRQCQRKPSPARTASGSSSRPGNGSARVYVQAGTAVGLYVIGRYVLPHAEGEPKNQQGLAPRLRPAAGADRVADPDAGHQGRRSAAIGRPANAARFRQAMRRPRSRPRPSSSGTWAIAAPGRPSCVAAYVAASRLHDNRHFLSDVIFGSAGHRERMDGRRPARQLELRADAGAGARRHDGQPDRTPPEVGR